MGKHRLDLDLGVASGGSAELLERWPTGLVNLAFQTRWLCLLARDLSAGGWVGLETAILELTLGQPFCKA